MKSAAFVLSNGMQAYVYPRPGLESVGIAIGVRYGSIDDRKEINGAAHYLEHMLFKGTARRTAQEIKQEIRDIGVNWNAFTTFETTVYYMQGYSVYFERMADILSDMITNSTLPEEEFELERGPVINEKLIHQDNPRFFFYDTFGKVLYKRHPAMRPVGGSRESIERTTRNNLLSIYNSYYTPKNMIAVVYGNVSVNEAKETLERHIGRFNRKYNKLRRKVANEPQVGRELTIRKENLKQARIGVGFKTLPCRKASMKEIVTLMVIGKILSFRLFDEVRDRSGLSYDPSANYYPFSTFGFIGAQAGAEPQKIGAVRKIMLDEMGKLGHGDITKDEVERAKLGLGIQYRMQRESTLDMVNSIASYALIMGSYKFVEELPDMVGRVSVGDVKTYCSKYISAKKCGIVVLKPS